MNIKVLTYLAKLVPILILSLIASTVVFRDNRELQSYLVGATLVVIVLFIASTVYLIIKEEKTIIGNYKKEIISEKYKEEKSKFLHFSNRYNEISERNKVMLIPIETNEKLLV